MPQDYSGDRQDHPNGNTQPPAADQPQEPMQMLPAANGSTGHDIEQFRKTFNMSPALALWFDAGLFNRAVQIAGSLSKAAGIVPRHLLGKPQTCFFVVEQALAWRLSPSFVARNCYETPGGQLGYYGVLCQAVLENSGQLEGGVTYEFEGDWSKVQGKFKFQQSSKGKDYPVPTYTAADEQGLAIIVRAKVKGEQKHRELRLEMRQFQPRNSTLWATDPKTQCCYAAVRRFANVAMPGVFAGLPFDHESDHIVDIIPPERPRPEDFAENSQTPVAMQRAIAEQTPTVYERPAPPHEPQARYSFVDFEGNVIEHTSASAACSGFEQAMKEAAAVGSSALEGVWEMAGDFLSSLRSTGKDKTADMLGERYTELLAEAEARERRAFEQESAKAKPAPSPAPAPKPAAANKPAAAPKRQDVQDNQGSLAPGAGDGLVPWTFKLPDYKEPTSPLKGGNWLAFIGWFSEILAAMPPEQIPDFLGEHNYGREYDALHAKRPGDAAEIDRIINRRKAP